MLNEITGEVTCDICGVRIGNYLNDHFFELIPAKYCPECGKAVRRNQLNEAQRRRRRRLKQEHKAQTTVIDELTRMIENLKEQNKLLEENVTRLKEEGRR